MAIYGYCETRSCKNKALLHFDYCETCIEARADAIALFTEVTTVGHVGSVFGRGEKAVATIVTKEWKHVELKAGQKLYIKG